MFDELVEDVQAAATAASRQSTALGKPLRQIDISVSYGFKFDVNADASFPIQLVTIGGNGDYIENNVQTVKLTLAPKTSLDRLKQSIPSAKRLPSQ